MSKILVVYWSQSGNTEAMAEAIGKGIHEAGKEALVKNVSEIKPEMLMGCSVFALGCPAMGSEVLEENEMEPFVSEVEKFASSKRIALFGSYGWGDGQWMREWEERMKDAGAVIVGGQGLITQEAPDDSCIEECIDIGRELARLT